MFKDISLLKLFSECLITVPVCERVLMGDLVTAGGGDVVAVSSATGVDVSSSKLIRVFLSDVKMMAVPTNLSR